MAGIRVSAGKQDNDRSGGNRIARDANERRIWLSDDVGWGGKRSVDGDPSALSHEFSVTHDLQAATNADPRVRSCPILKYGRAAGSKHLDVRLPASLTAYRQALSPADLIGPLFPLTSQLRPLATQLSKFLPTAAAWR
jgi:hypothetical protein